eukprot:TRINITY_DN87433_c0_g1_i1.p1 TRINITY_DN87433_c0_g1~~TRINITY_DN87433_c0_g1_i1.p1  ORF type:complete len:115 (+),score=21.61 TRINITY_DN87433_c0_g1_i1:98-442(+)
MKSQKIRLLPACKKKPAAVFDLCTGRVKVVESNEHKNTVALRSKGSTWTRSNTTQRQVTDPATGKVMTHMVTTERKIQLKRLGPYLIRRQVSETETKSVKTRGKTAAKRASKRR